MFDLIQANTVDDRIDELGKFIEFWYGPHKPEFEITELDARLPAPLALFYRRHGNRPCPRFDDPFYQGDGGHHLFHPKDLEYQPEQRIKFFMEYQGDWDGYTLDSEADPPVWLVGHLPTDETFESDEKGERLLNQTLSQFLITHVLLISLYEHALKTYYGEHHPDLVDRFHGARNRRIIWDSENLRQPYCPYYAGKVHLCADSVLVLEDTRGIFVFASKSEDGFISFDA